MRVTVGVSVGLVLLLLARPAAAAPLPVAKDARGDAAARRAVEATATEALGALQLSTLPVLLADANAAFLLGEWHGCGGVIGDPDRLLADLDGQLSRMEWERAGSLLDEALIVELCEPDEAGAATIAWHYAALGFARAQEGAPPTHGDADLTRAWKLGLDVAEVPEPYPGAFAAGRVRIDALGLDVPPPSAAIVLFRPENAVAPPEAVVRRLPDETRVLEVDRGLLDDPDTAAGLAAALWAKSGPAVILDGRTAAWLGPDGWEERRIPLWTRPALAGVLVAGAAGLVGSGLFWAGAAGVRYVDTHDTDSRVTDDGRARPYMTMQRVGAYGGAAVAGASLVAASVSLAWDLRSARWE